MADYELLKTAVYNALGIGAEHARTRKELCRAVMCSDRLLRQAIEDLRYEYPIITNDDGTGYYIPTQDAAGRGQAARWLKRQNSRRRAIWRATRGARRFLAHSEQE